MSLTRARLQSVEARQAGQSPMAPPPGMSMGHRGPGDTGSITPSAYSLPPAEHRIDTPEAISVPATEPDIGGRAEPALGSPAPATGEMPDVLVPLERAPVDLPADEEHSAWANPQRMETALARLTLLEKGAAARQAPPPSLSPTAQAPIPHQWPRHESPFIAAFD